MLANRRRIYKIYVGSALLPQSPSIAKSTKLYVDIRLAGEQEVHHTRMQRIPCWNEEFRLIGHSLSIISLKIKQNGADAHIPDRYIGRVKIPLGTLLKICAGEEVAVLKFTWMAMKPEHPTIGFLTARLSSLEDPAVLKSLAMNQIASFERIGGLLDLENAIGNLLEASYLTEDGHPDKLICLCNLGISQKIRYDRLGQMSDLESSIESLREALELPDDGHPYKPHLLSKLGISLRARFQCLGEIPDLESAIANFRKVVEITPDGHPERPGCLTNLGTCQATRFRHLGELSDLQSAIANQREAVELTTDAHPKKPACLVSLGNSQRVRFEHLGKLSDLDSAITNLGKAVKLADDAHPDKAIFVSSLGTVQQIRFMRLGELADLNSAIANLRVAVKLTNNGHPEKPSRVADLGISLQTRFENLGELSDLESAIANLREAVEATDDEHSEMPRLLSNLGITQRIRFERLGELSDLESAIANLRVAIKLTNDGNPHKSGRLMNLGSSQHTRFERLGELSDLESAITNLLEAAELTDDKHPERPGCLSNLGISQRDRFDRLGEMSDLESAIVNLQTAVKLIDDNYPDKPHLLSNLGISQRTRFEHLGDLSDLESAIANLRVAIKLTNDGNPHKSGRLMNQGSCLQTRFEHLHDLSDLDGAIAILREATTLTDDGHPNKPHLLFNLGINQQIRFECLGELPDHIDAILSFKSAAQSSAAYPRKALAAARSWARLSQIDGLQSSALDAYRTAMEILPQVAWLGLDTSSRQRWLLEEQPESLGCLAATCAIQLGRFEEAVELLDLARSVFWQQASSVRGDLTDLRKEHLELARDFERVGQALNASSFSDSSLLISDTKNGGDRVQKHRRSVLEMESLIKRTRKLPGFEFFRKPTPFQQLRPIPGAGHVVIVNVSLNGADALIFDDRHPIQHVPLPDVDLETLTQQSRNFMLQQPSSATLKQQRNYVKTFLKPALRAIGEDVIEPIFNALGIPLQNTVLANPPSRRILWYLTGPLTFIPIHAAGPSGKGFDVSRLVISSYITTLASLSQAQKRHAEVALARPKLLAVSQPHTPGQTPLEKSTAEVENVIQIVSAAGWPAEDLEHLDGADAVVGRVSDALDTCSWVHFACHALQDNTEGMKSAFALHDGDLYLSMVASKRLSSAQLAFLSACQAASGLQGLPGEAMHLAAGIQFAGFLSVIATTWSIRDEDAIKVAEHTYGYLLRNGMEKIDLSEAATALNHAVLRLREDPAVTVDRWAPFVHFGI